MKIENLKELKALVLMCRENGVCSISLDGITMQIEAKDEPTAADLKTEQPKPEVTYSNEDVLMWSSTPTGV